MLYCDKPTEKWRNAILALHLPEDLFLSDDDIRWHIAAFLDEYVLDKDIVNAIFGSLNLRRAEDYLNRSGKQLLAELRNQRYCVH